MKVKFPVSVHPEFDEGMIPYIRDADGAVLFNDSEVEQVVARANALTEVLRAAAHLRNWNDELDRVVTKYEGMLGD